MHHRKRTKATSTDSHQPDKNTRVPMSYSLPTNHDVEVASGPNHTNAETNLPARPPISQCCITYTNAGFYVLSGCSQPLIMALMKEASIADPVCQTYMLFYYLFPAGFLLPVIWKNEWPQRNTILKACGIATWDILSTSMNYTGASLAGPTVFAIIYSSVTIWTAVFSQVFLGRLLSLCQWMMVVVVFSGLTLTAADSLTLGKDVTIGSFLVLVGSAMHALTYVMSEAIMTRGDDKLNVYQNTGIQGFVAAGAFLMWQVFYTIPHFEKRVWAPMQESDTTILYAFYLLILFGVANFIHSITFFHTLLNFPGGATSAGVMKGLQAVLVFLFTDLLYCGKIGGSEMCFSRAKFLSLVTVCGGVLGYGYATENFEKNRNRTLQKREHKRVEHETPGNVDIVPLSHETTRLLGNDDLS